MASDAQLIDQQGNRKYLNPLERLQFHRVAKETPDLVARAFLLTLFYTGCRISEATQLTHKSIDFPERVLIIRTLKQRKKNRYRILPLPTSMLVLLRSLSKMEGVVVEQRLFPFSRTTGWRLVRNCMKRAGIRGSYAVPKALRHGLAIAAVSQGIPLPTIQKWLGHASIKTTGFYLNFVGEDERGLAKQLWPDED